MRKSIAFYLSILGIISSTMLVIKLRQTTPPSPPLNEPSRNPYPHSVAASGMVEAMNENISIGTPVSGLVTEVYVQVWDSIKKGQPLFKLDDRDLQAQLLIQEANVKIAEATLIRLRDQLSRLQSIHDPRAISLEELRTRENDVSIAEAQLASSKAQAQQTKTLLDRLIICAPQEGSLLQSNIRSGEYLSLTPKNPAMILGNLDLFQIRAQVDEQNAPFIQKGRPATAYLKGFTNDPIPLKFIRIEPFVIPKESLTGGSNERVDTRVLQVIYAFDQPKNRSIYVGQQVDVFIETNP